MTSKAPQTLLGTLLIAACVLAAYANALHGAFVFDDAISIVHNETIGTLWPPSVPLTGPHESPSAGRPLVSLSLALNFAAGGLETFGYHAFNLAVHLLVCLLLRSVARRLLERSPGLEDHAPALSLAIALIFAVHPIGTSVVSYVSQRAESMMALFFLAGLYSWIRHLDAPPGRGWARLTVLCCILATLCKEVGYALPLVAVLLDRAYFSSSWRELWARRKGTYLAMCSAWLILLASIVLGARGATVTWSYRDYDSWTYLLTSARAILHYVSLLFWPQPLVIDYGWPIARTLSDAWWQVALLSASLAASILCLNRRPRVAFAGLSAFIILAPSSSVIPIVTEIMAEHRMYLPSAIVVSLVVVLAHRLLARSPLPPVAARWVAGLVLVATVATLTWVTRSQNRLYDDPLTMYRHNVACTPDNYRAHYNLGYHLIRADQYDQAREALEAALRIDPTYAPAHREMSYLACYTGDTRAALGHIDRALDLKPTDPFNLTAKGSFLALLNRPEEGMGYIEQALKQEPGFSEALKWRVNVLLLARKTRAADRALAEYNPSLAPQQRQQELQIRYRDLMRMVQAGEGQ